ncbi:MAG TPA: hypothetical protein VNE42_04785 [Acidimicrobiales bacterium]|nr:hypothetical protein [Acidimicrobiales bacterium]
MTLSSEPRSAESDHFNWGQYPGPPIGGISDEELSELALGAEVDRPLADDAIAIGLVPESSSSLLGAWYMAPVAARRVAGWRMWVMLSIVGILLILEALGLCSVFGQVVIG